MLLPDSPNTLAGWYAWADKLSNQYKKMLCILGRNEKNQNNKKSDNQMRFSSNPSSSSSHSSKDPNAMDIDALTPEKHAEMMHKGLCFQCGKQGHLSHDCPNKNKIVASFTKEVPALKQMKGKELHTHINGRWRKGRVL